MSKKLITITHWLSESSGKKCEAYFPCNGDCKNYELAIIQFSDPVYCITSSSTYSNYVKFARYSIKVYTVTMFQKEFVRSL